MKKKVKDEMPKNIILPFSEGFIPHWQLWRDYKLEEFGFKYKGVISEQAALINLSTLSGGDEYKAIEIINQSIQNRWRGLFMLPKNRVNERPSTKAGTADFRRSVQAELESRLAKGG